MIKILFLLVSTYLLVSCSSQQQEPVRKKSTDFHTQESMMHWFRFNMDRPPFDHITMRKAFWYATHRLTQAEGQKNFTDEDDVDVLVAQGLFNRALHELNIEQDALPLFTILCRDIVEEKWLAEQAKLQWENIFHVRVNIIALSLQEYQDKVELGDYMIVGSTSTNEKIINNTKRPMAFLVEEKALVPVQYSSSLLFHQERHISATEEDNTSAR